MKIVLTTVGTTGDVQPYFALAGTLKKRGHEVRVASHDLHAERFQRAGIDFTPVGPSVTVAALNAIFEEARKVDDPLKHFDLVVKKLFLADPARSFREHLEVSKNADVVVCHRYDYLGQEAAIKNGKRWISVTLVPNLIPSKDVPPYPFENTGRWWTQVLWEAVRFRCRATNRAVAAALKELGLPPRELGIAGVESPHLNLIAASQALFDLRPTWPSDQVVTGSWVFEEPNYEPPRALEEFFAAHEAPLVITFGSMGEANIAKTTALIKETLAMLDRPAIVHRGYSGFDALASPKTFVVDYVPYAYLFARASCVVHHAAPGTSYWACRAGVPSVPVPHLFEQFYWAGMLERRGVAPKPLFHAKLSAKKLALGIEEATRSANMRSRAQAIARVLKEERGAETAADQVEQIAYRR